MHTLLIHISQFHYSGLPSAPSRSKTMATSSLSLPSTLTPHSKSPVYPRCFSQSPSPPLLSFTRTLKPYRAKPTSVILPNGNSVCLTVKAQALDFLGSFFEGGGSRSDDDPTRSDDDPTSVPPVGTATAVEEKEEPQCPPGLRQYETMMVLRPDMSEDERLALTQKYEEVIIRYIHPPVLAKFIVKMR